MAYLLPQVRLKASLPSPSESGHCFILEILELIFPSGGVGYLHNGGLQEPYAIQRLTGWVKEHSKMLLHSMQPYG